MSDNKNVFISHYGKDDDSVQGLKKLLSNNGYTLRNSSIDSTKPNNATNEDYIKSLLRKKMEWAGSAIVLIGPETHTREWVNWEIDLAHRLGKPIVGVFMQGATDSDVPESFEKYGDSLVGWRSDKIIEALEGTYNSWSGSNGEPWKGKYSTERVVC
ncbi:TIR domain-containing protein [Photobacterium damselae]|uniref:TIR domain-containing protein n=1 Tax=Photobacterium damselae TaxID=38293 RepID=UPI003C6E5B3B